MMNGKLCVPKDKGLIKLSPAEFRRETMRKKIAMKYTRYMVIGKDDLVEVKAKLRVEFF